MKAGAEKQESMVLDEKYFSYENLGQIAGIDNHLEFLKSVSEKYISQKEKKEFDELVTAIEFKQKDKLLNMSVIGEFSGGKSTFINALMRMELLSTCLLQGTTVANTVIEYSKDYYIKLSSKTEAIREEKILSFEELCNKVNEYTTDSEITRNLNSVQVGIPSQRIQNIFRIIDTPGTNSLELWHEEVTMNALRELSDVSVILIDSTKILPETLCNFINNNLEKILPQCAFVLTKFELIPEKERDMLLAYTRMKIENSFGLKDALVLPFSSFAILEGDEENEMYKLSIESEKKLIEFMAKKKAVAQLKKIIYFADLLYNTANESINTAYKETEQQLEILVKTKQTNLLEFVNNEKSTRVNEFIKEASSIEKVSTEDVSKLISQGLQNIILKIKSQQTTEGLRAYINNVVESDCQYVVKRVFSYYDGRFHQVSRYARSQITGFNEEFQKQFNDLKLLNAYFAKYEEKRMLHLCESINNILARKKYEGNKLRDANVAVTDSTVKGALIGTAIFPIVGTAIGAGVGALLGGLFQPTIEKMREDAISKLVPNINSYITGIQKEMANDFRNQILYLSNSIKTEIDAYYAEYRETVDLKISEATNKQSIIKNKLNSINIDMQEVKNRRYILTSVENQIALIDGRE